LFDFVYQNGPAGHYQIAPGERMVGLAVIGSRKPTPRREWIAGYQVPKTIELRSEPLPLSGAMKVLKR
jgi:hypothetical protein